MELHTRDTDPDLISIASNSLILQLLTYQLLHPSPDSQLGDFIIAHNFFLGHFGAFPDDALRWLLALSGQNPEIPGTRRFSVLFPYRVCAPVYWRKAASSWMVYELGLVGLFPCVSALSLLKYPVNMRGVKGNSWFGVSEPQNAHRRRHTELLS